MYTFTSVNGIFNMRCLQGSCVAQTYAHAGQEGWSCCSGAPWGVTAHPQLSGLRYQSVGAASSPHQSSLLLARRPGRKAGIEKRIGLHSLRAASCLSDSERLKNMLINVSSASFSGRIFICSLLENHNSYSNSSVWTSTLFWLAAHSLGFFNNHVETRTTSNWDSYLLIYFY